MSCRVVDHSPDLQHLHRERYDISVVADRLLVVGHVPYVTPSKAVAFGRLVTTLEKADGVRTDSPVGDHSLWFIGEMPCDKDGGPLRGVVIQSQDQEIEPGLVVNHRFSVKPTTPDPRYPDYYTKITAYIATLMTHSLAVDPSAKATLDNPVLLPDDDRDSPFVYGDTASSRARISDISAKLRIGRVAIVGLGGTGSYILDLIAKTEINEIHLFDGDVFLDHNAFRSPGATSMEDLAARLTKVELLANRYLVMKHKVIPHPYFIDETNVVELRDMEFVFLAAEGGAVKRVVIENLEIWGTPFIDVGLAVNRSDDTLGGMVCVTTSTPAQHDHVRRRVDMSEPDEDDIYEDHIQIADLNALNAALAVIRWKKHCGFYRDYGREHFSAYTINTNQLSNADKT
jgi:hypothetical protein